MQRLFLLVVLVLGAGIARAGDGLYKASIAAPADAVYGAVYAALEERRIWVVFEADIGQNMAGMAKRWGEDYNRNGLQAIRSMVACNAWLSNQVANADPDMLALCPLHVTVIEREGVSSVLFARPTSFAGDSPARDVLAEIESNVIEAIDAALAKLR
ncbi:MAG: DUF302 domain-containing protein [Chromatiales bacterium]|nr:DUF302 domain-containing protein [Chromatiales bacterium]